jgi:hypothetical protein
MREGARGGGSCGVDLTGEEFVRGLGSVEQGGRMCSLKIQSEYF